MGLAQAPENLYSFDCYKGEWLEYKFSKSLFAQTHHLPPHLY